MDLITECAVCGTEFTWNNDNYLKSTEPVCDSCGSLEESDDNE